MAGVQRHSSSTAGVKGSSRKAAEPPLIVLPISIWRPLAQNTSSRSSKWGDMGDDRFKAEGGWKAYALRRLWPCPSREPSLYV